MLKAAAFDIDNTLTDNVSWLALTDLLGASSKTLQDILRRFLADELSYDDAVRQVTELWQSTGRTDKATWQQIFNDWPLKQGAPELITYLLEQGYDLALITGSVDLFAQTIAARLHIPYWYANATLLWDEHDNLTSFIYVRDQKAQKLQHLHEFAQQIGVSVEDCVVVGDGDNDLETFRQTKHGIAVDSKSQNLLAASWKQVQNLSEIIPILANPEL